jgi:glycosyltransferase involved in cell wall biosynthesis
MERIEREAARHADRLLVVSEMMKSHVVTNWGVSASRVRIIPNGGFQSPRRATFSTTPRLVYGGILAYWEKWIDFVEMSRYWDVAGSELLMLGGGPDMRMLRRQLRILRPNNLRYVGMRSRDEALELFSQSQIGVAPSSNDLARRVAWPIKVMDYMSLGLPVIAPMVGDWGRLVKECNAGVVTAQSDPREFCRAAKDLCEKEEWTRASKNAFDTIQSNYLWRQVLEPLDDLYL